MPIPKWAMPKPKKGMALANLLIKDHYLEQLKWYLASSPLMYRTPSEKAKEQLEYMERP